MVGGQGNKVCHGDGFVCMVETVPWSFFNLSDMNVKLAACYVSAGALVRIDVPLRYL